MRHTILSIICLATVSATPVKDAVLTKAVTNNILTPEGKVIGFVKLSAGTHVTVDAVTNDGILIHRDGESSFKVSKDSVSINTLTAVETPTPAPAPINNPILQMAQNAIKTAQSEAQTAQTKTQEFLTNANVQNAVDKIEATLKQSVPTASTIATLVSPNKQVKTEDSLLAGYHGSNVKAFLIAGLTPYLGSKENAESQINPLKINEDIPPQTALFSLNGKEIRGTNATGRLSISIEKESNHPDTSGLSSDDLNALKTALIGTSRYALAQLTTSPTISPLLKSATANTTKNNSYTVLLSNYDPTSDSFLCRKAALGRNDENNRLPSSELSLGGISYVLATIKWTEKGITSESAIPKDFHYDKNLTIPDKFVFLKIPFEQQAEDGICTAAATMNVVKYIDPSITLKQRELFSMFNNRTIGASSHQVASGLQDLGFETEIVILRKIKPQEAEAKILASLEDGRPVIAMGAIHCISIIGYDVSQNKLIAWDQNGQDLTNTNGMPTGMIQCNTERFEELIFLRKGSQSPSPKEEEQIKALTGTANALQKHTIINSDSGAENLERFADHALPPRLKSLMSQGRTILIPTRDGLISIPPQEIGETVNCVTLPDNKPTQKYISEIARLTAQNAGAFFSISNQP